MSSRVEKSSCGSWGACSSGYAGKASWSGFNIAAMVIAFVLFWPIGLLVLFWILKGRDVKDLPGAIREQWFNFNGKWGGKRHMNGNRVFNDFQQTQYDRIREIKDEIKDRSNRFSEFQADAKRRADQEEFNQFMASSPSSK